MQELWRRISSEHSQEWSRFISLVYGVLRTCLIRVEALTLEVGIPQKHPLPLTTAAYHICTFRHGLALDELRVKFLPTYLAGGWTPNLQLDEYFGPDDKLMNAKEVWFVGSHSDVYVKPHLLFALSSNPLFHSGGGQHAPSLGLVSLLWMENQAIDAGLRFEQRTFGGEWMWDDLHKTKPTASLRSYWRLAEILPFKRYRYTDPNSTTKYYLSSLQRRSNADLVTECHILAKVVQLSLVNISMCLRPSVVKSTNPKPPFSVTRQRRWNLSSIYI